MPLTSPPAAAERIAFFPHINAGCPRPAPGFAEAMISTAWLIMTEAFAYIEDVDGAPESPELLEVARIRLAELLFDIDCRLRGVETPDELHHLPLLLELGLSEVADLDGEEMAATLGLADVADPDAGPARVDAFFMALLAAFPGELSNALLPENQGRVIRTLRQWNGVCTAVGRDPAFLVPLIKAL